MCEIKVTSCFAYKHMVDVDVAKRFYADTAAMSRDLLTKLNDYHDLQAQQQEVRHRKDQEVSSKMTQLQDVRLLNAITCSCI